MSPVIKWVVLPLAAFGMFSGIMSFMAAGQGDIRAALLGSFVSGAGLGIAGVTAFVMATFGRSK